jgi:hypothetical protein
MAIAILGWGSLIPCPGDLSIRGGWQTEGPILRIEFSRKSADGRLTLVIDTERGSEITTQYAESACLDVNEAAQNLKQREGTTIGNIGICSRRAGETRSQKHPEVVATVTEWLIGSRFDAVIWTDLESNFAMGRNRAELLEEAFNYLDGLSAVCKTNARHYINTAPPQTQTDLRRYLQSKGWL